MRHSSLILAAALAACQQQATNNVAQTAEPADVNAAPISVDRAAPVNDSVPVPIPGPPGGPPSKPAPSPPPPHVDPNAPSPPAEKTALGAARRLLEYCDAVATRRYADAYRLWSDDGRASGMTQKQFTDSFAKYAAYDCHIGPPGELDGAAGSIFVEIPLRVTGVLARGGGFVLEGPVTMRRVNDVPGSSADQRRWHIAQSGLKPRP